MNNFYTILIIFKKFYLLETTGMEPYRMPNFKAARSLYMRFNFDWYTAGLLGLVLR